MTTLNPQQRPLLVGIIVVVLAAAAGGAYYYAGRKQTSIVNPSPSISATPSSNPETRDFGDVKYGGPVFAGTVSPLLDFNETDFNTALKSGKIILLYFYNSADPKSQDEFKVAQAAFNELTNDQVVGFRVNFNDNATDDTERALAQQLKVTASNTKVIIKNGEPEFTSTDNWNKETYLAEISNSLGK